MTSFLHSAFLSSLSFCPLYTQRKQSLESEPHLRRLLRSDLVLSPTAECSGSTVCSANPSKVRGLLGAGESPFSNAAPIACCCGPALLRPWLAHGSQLASANSLPSAASHHIHRHGFAWSRAHAFGLGLGHRPRAIDDDGDGDATDERGDAGTHRAAGMDLVQGGYAAVPPFCIRGARRTPPMAAGTGSPARSTSAGPA
eukprot:921058-Rhodomonas_salina.1